MRYESLQLKSLGHLRHLSEEFSRRKMALNHLGQKRPNRKSEFSKLNEFDLGVIRRIVHSFFARNESPSLSKLLKKLKEEINFPF